MALSVHRGSKVVMSLCVCRLPTRFLEPEFAKEHRQWLQEWKARTNSDLNISDGLVYLKTPGHFLPSIEERQKQTGTEKVASLTQSGNELEDLLASEGIPELSKKREGLKDLAELGNIEQEKNKEAEDERTDLQWLIVKYRDSPSIWTFPFTHRRGSDSAHMTLRRLTAEQLGIKSHLPGLAPIAFRKIKSGDLPSRLFYYKGIQVPDSSVSIPTGSNISAHKWVNRTELEQHLVFGSWLTLRDALPLD